MDWNTIVENIKIFFEQPVAIIGCSVGCLLFYSLVFISKTSFGKKSILRLKTSYNELLVKFNDLVAQTGEKVENMRKQYEEQVAIVEKHTLELENLLFAISENINNKKVKELVEQYKSTKENFTTSIDELLENSSLALNEKIKEVQNQLEEYKNALKEEYEKSIESYKSELENLHKQLEENGDETNGEPNE